MNAKLYGNKTTLMRIAMSIRLFTALYGLNRFRDRRVRADTEALSVPTKLQLKIELVSLRDKKKSAP